MRTSLVVGCCLALAACSAGPQPVPSASAVAPASSAPRTASSSEAGSHASGFAHTSCSAEPGEILGMYVKQMVTVKAIVDGTAILDLESE